MKSLYLLIDFFTILVPLIFSFHPKLRFYKNFRAFFTANLIVGFLFILWDIYFTKIGVWGFNSEYLTGNYFFNLPIEEVLFFICIPFACIFTYHCINLFYHLSWRPMAEHLFLWSSTICLLVIGSLFYTRSYTSVTFISLGILLPILKYIAKINWLSKLVLVYPILLIPFFIVNGILTGTGLPSPVVWYNDQENLGIRMFTIPIEDLFYGFELILLHVFFYELFRNKLNKSV